MVMIDRLRHAAVLGILLACSAGCTGVLGDPRTPSASAPKRCAGPSVYPARASVPAGTVLAHPEMVQQFKDAVNSYGSAAEQSATRHVLQWRPAAAGGRPGLFHPAIVITTDLPGYNVDYSHTGPGTSSQMDANDQGRLQTDLILDAFEKWWGGRDEQQDPMYARMVQVVAAGDTIVHGGRHLNRQLCPAQDPTSP
ncbi:hypothetical protein [Kitasatospora griseola]|uniref:hypothetical protein n=1 Tax=Kitasatospora griseola TaxID=2064 RepID=UPI003436E08F